MVQMETGQPTTYRQPCFIYSGEIDTSIKAFLQYVDGVLTADRFVQEIDEEIQRVKMIEGEAMGYMTYEIKISQNIFKSPLHFVDISFKTA